MLSRRRWRLGQFPSDTQESESLGIQGLFFPGVVERGVCAISPHLTVLLGHVGSQQDTVERSTAFDLTSAEFDESARVSQGLDFF